ncbi:DUF397 domain-containing protein [Streptomyces zingiberis]|uniref:DUF397 domain-containing protein n=1 Tax=Streptomyces zingiberis TaxID=2053010 RepID=A0ABX1BXQ6_9ACTN|nr:DUF397 domain-containing protein [Streptomyces zingiberis]NJQ01256.1 DUF397 domain-containing protein [Streptomyces zingiberis]
MRAIDPSTANWRKSSYSNSTGGDCVEVSCGVAATVPVRDSKNPHGPVIPFTTVGWGSFITALRRGELGA